MHGGFAVTNQPSNDVTVLIVWAQVQVFAVQLRLHCTLKHRLLAAVGCKCRAKLQRLGQLMDASHASCAGLYQCSCEELDQLVAAAKAAGALGARLTGTDQHQLPRQAAGTRWQTQSSSAPLVLAEEKAAVCFAGAVQACCCWLQVLAGVAAQCHWCGRTTLQGLWQSSRTSTSSHL